MSLLFVRINGVIVETSSKFGFRTQTLSLLLKLGSGDPQSFRSYAAIDLGS